VKPNKALKMLGFVPQPNLPWSAFLGLTEQYWGVRVNERLDTGSFFPFSPCPLPLVLF